MKYGKAVVTGCVKNSAVFLPDVLLNLDRLTELYEEVAFVFIENDSIDQTKSILNEWGRSKKYFKIHSFDGLDQYEKNRTVRLEIARNAYINAIREDHMLSTFDHLIIMDMDDRGAHPVTLDALSSALDFLNEKEQHAAVFANQSVKYYDLWALRHPQLCPFDFWHEVLSEALHVTSDQEAFDKVYAKVPKCIPVGTPPIQVESAFGGLGIYKMRFISNNKSRYIGHEYKYFGSESMVFSKLQTCEHVSFHQGIAAQGGQMFILPNLVNSDQDTGFNPSAFRTIVIQR